MVRNSILVNNKFRHDVGLVFVVIIGKISTMIGLKSILLYGKCKHWYIN